MGATTSATSSSSWSTTSLACFTVQQLAVLFRGISSILPDHRDSLIDRASVTYTFACFDAYSITRHNSGIQEFNILSRLSSRQPLPTQQMEPHELALAALNEYAQTNYGRHTTNDGLLGSKATGSGMDMTPSATRQTSPLLSEHEASLSQTQRGLEELSSAALGLVSDTQSTDEQETGSTPPTSTSDGFSLQGTNQVAPVSQLSQLSQLAAAQESLGSPPRPTVATAGQKRTADGRVKATSISPQARSHSRNISTVSNASSATSRIGEVEKSRYPAGLGADKCQLSSELRTRLTYAMCKVNNGWQSHSIDEVESLASQAGSPTSSNSTLQGRRNLITSPRTVIANIQEHSANIPSITQPPLGDFDLYSRHEQPSRTYESFWRDHSTTNHPTYRQHQPVNSPQINRLAPPADIRPTASSRRSDSSKLSRPPRMPSHGSNSPRTGPSTPHRPDFRDNPAIQTSTQKTLQEQDAIETLLFMSSPGNSGNMGHVFPPPRTHVSPQQSPLRAEFSVQKIQGRRVEFDTGATSGSTGSSESGPEYRAQMRRKQPQSRVRGEAIDRMLDEMADSSSDEDEILLTYTSPRRVPAGRV